MDDNEMKDKTYQPGQDFEDESDEDYVDDDEEMLESEDDEGEEDLDEEEELDEGDEDNLSSQKQYFDSGVSQFLKREKNSTTHTILKKNNVPSKSDLKRKVFKKVSLNIFLYIFHIKMLFIFSV